MVGSRIVWIQLNCPAILILRPLPIPIRNGLDGGQRSVRLRETLVVFECQRYGAFRETQDFQLPTRSYHHVMGFDVAVKNTVRVSFSQSFRSLPGSANAVLSGSGSRSIFSASVSPSMYCITMKVSESTSLTS